MDQEEKKNWLRKMLGFVTEAIEELEDGAEFSKLGTHEDTNIHHIHDHLGWAEHLLSQELKKVEGGDVEAKSA